MTDNQYLISESDVVKYGLEIAFLLAWLKARDRCGNYLLLSEMELEQLARLPISVTLSDLETKELISVYATEGRYSVEILEVSAALSSDVIRELKQQGLSPQSMESALYEFSKGVHLDPSSLMAEYYRSLPITSMGIQKAFVHFAIQYQALYHYELGGKNGQPTRPWTPQIKTLQILAGEEIPQTFIHEKRLEFSEAIRLQAGVFQRASTDHHFLDFCRNAWCNADNKRREFERQLSV